MFTRLMKWTFGLMLLAAAGTARADNFAVGSLSLNGDFNENVYFITVDNLTGDPDLDGFAFFQDYPVYTFLRFDNPSITYTTLDSSGTLVATAVNLDSIFAGPLDAAEVLYFDSSVVFQSISFTASIYPDTFTANSQIYQASDVTASAQLANGDGSPLGPPTYADILVSADLAPSATPEPGTVLPPAAALFLLWISVRRKCA
jgi:hypothetical protein